MLVKLERAEEGLVAGQEAHEADPDWEDPVVFISQQQLVQGQLEAAEEILKPLLEYDPVAPDVQRQQRLVDYVKDDSVPLTIVADFLRLKDRPPNEERAEALDALWHKHPNFIQLREQLAWNLVKIDKDKEASAHFKDMSALKLDPEIHSSVLLGLGFLTNRQFKHRQPGARVRAAASAMTQSFSAEEIAAAEREYQQTQQSDEPRQRSATKAIDTSGILAQEVEAGGEEVVEQSTGEVEIGEPAVEASKAVFTGDLQLFAVPDLLDFLNASRRTGTLVITSENGIGAIYLSQGWITGAASPSTKSVGDMLVTKGVISEDQLNGAIESQRTDSPDRLLGSILAEKGLVEKNDLERALIDQVKTALHEIVEWKSGQFAFEPDKRNGSEEVGEIEIQLDTRSVLLDVLREVDEANR
jgi:hypothetical protein